MIQSFTSQIDQFKLVKFKEFLNTKTSLKYVCHKKIVHIILQKYTKFELKLNVSFLRLSDQDKDGDLKMI